MPINKDYNKIADEQLKLKRFDLALEYYKRSLNLNPYQPIIIDVVDSIESRLDFSKCCCKSPGYCCRYNKEMEASPPNWQWCQGASYDDRKDHYEQSLVNELTLQLNLPRKYIRQLIYSTDVSDTDNFKELLRVYKNKATMFFSNPNIPFIVKNDKSYEFMDLYYLTNVNFPHNCLIASRNQKKINKQIIRCSKKQKSKQVNINNIEILCLGHSDEQFKFIDDKPYLTKVNLNDINAGEYSGNEWAESRVFASKENLFTKNTDFIGLTSASWNSKYEPFNFIDEFEDWKYASLLLNSKPTDNIVLCANVYCCCSWVNGNVNQSKKPLLAGFFEKKYDIIGKYLLNMFGLNNFKHVKVPYGNQMIMHKDNYMKYLEFLHDKQVFKNVDWIVKNYAKKYVHKNDPIKQKYQDIRLQAYIMEMVTCLWFGNQNFLIVPTTQLKQTWYSHDQINHRIKNWMNK